MSSLGDMEPSAGGEAHSRGDIVGVNTGDSYGESLGDSNGDSGDIVGERSGDTGGGVLGERLGDGCCRRRNAGFFLPLLGEARPLGES